MRRLLLVLATVSACNAPAVFECTSAAQCTDGTVIGKCEPTGYCSFIDFGCPSGYRYDVSAGDSLGTQCVDGVRTRQKAITIAGSKVAEMCSAFPIWIDITDPDLAAHARPDGSDLTFTDANGGDVPYEIQGWAAATGHLTAWIRPAQLDAGIDAVFYVQYGTARKTTPDARTVFNNGFAAVWHLDDALVTTIVADATETHAGTSAGLDVSRQVDAKLGGGINFDATGDMIQFANPLIGSGSHTISAWVNLRTATAFNGIVIVGSSLTNESRWFHSSFMSQLSIGFYGNDWVAAPSVDNAGWTLLHWVFNGPTRVSFLYRDGVQLGTFNHASGIDTKGMSGYLGYAPKEWGPATNTPVTLNGILDEVRIATVPRSAGWIATEFANQSSPSTFYSVGAEELLPLP